MNNKKRILVAPLNWGFGHATRCIPIIDALLDHGFEPILASDGDALSLLQKEYPNLLQLELPSYNISYSKRNNGLKWKLLKDSPNILKAINKEKEVVDQIILEHNISGLISDNRYGINSKDIPSVFVTHQLRVLSGSTTWLSSKVQQNYLAGFDECWVPDFHGRSNLSGKMGHLKQDKPNIRYIGPISRFQIIDVKKIYDLAVILSGPEPQRTILENILTTQLKGFKGRVLLVRGVMEDQQKKVTRKQMTVVNFMLHEELEKAINASDIILARSGYTTIMDLAKLGKKAFFIPTPGQFEQEYLAKNLKKRMIAPYSKQKEFEIKHLNEVHFYKGFSPNNNLNDLKELFDLFKGK